MNKEELLEDLEKLYLECSKENWGGCVEEAISEIAYLNTKTLIEQWPEGVSFPELAPEPDGAISLDWIKNKNEILSVSVMGQNTLPFCRAQIEEDEWGKFEIDFSQPLFVNGNGETLIEVITENGF